LLGVLYPAVLEVSLRGRGHPEMSCRYATVSRLLPVLAADGIAKVLPPAL